MHYFLGVEAIHDSSGLFVSQWWYTLDLLHRAKMEGAKTYTTPMCSHTKLSKFEGNVLPDLTFYLSIVGALQYLMLTRLEIAFAINEVCQFMHKPMDIHWTKCLNASLGLHVRPSSSPRLNGFSDADWADCPEDRCSTSGYCIYFGNTLISWSARKQKTVSQSSTEAAYHGLAIATAEIMWIQSLLTELNAAPSTPPTLWCDNLGATYLTVNPVFHARTKRIEIDYHFVRERVSRYALVVRLLSTKDQIVDIFTKGLPRIPFQHFRDKLTVQEGPLRLRGCMDAPRELAKISAPVLETELRMDNSSPTSCDQSKDGNKSLSSQSFCK